MSLILPLMIKLLFIILISYWNYYKNPDLRKKFKAYRIVVPEPFLMKRYNFNIFGPSNSVEKFLIKDCCGFYVSVIVFCIDENQWLGYNKYCVDDLKLLDNISIFANSHIIFDYMGEKIRLPVIDSL